MCVCVSYLYQGIQHLPVDYYYGLGFRAIAFDMFGLLAERSNNLRVDVRAPDTDPSF